MGAGFALLLPHALRASRIGGSGIALAQFFADDVITFFVGAGIEIAQILEQLLDVNGLAGLFRREDDVRQYQGQQQ